MNQEPLPKQQEHDIDNVRHVSSMNEVARDGVEDEDWLRDANEMELEDGAIWVFGVAEGGVRFTDLGIERIIQPQRKSELLRRAAD